MSTMFLRGAALTTASTLGFADNSDIGPTAGNGFFRRWPDDLAVLQEVGVTDLRLTLDWARLQPRPAELDEDWAERYEQILTAADAIGLRVWATLHDGSIPRWFDNDGGFGDDETFTRWWPRWVQRVAERFGDDIAAWIPFAEIPTGTSAQPWRDTWTILESDRPVVASVAADTSIAQYVGKSTHLGLALPTDWELDERIGERELEIAAHRWGQLVRDGADAIDGPVVITGFCPNHADDDTAARIMGQLIETLDDAIADGVRLEVCFVEPAIAAPEMSSGLLDPDRKLTPAAELFLP